MRGRPKLTDSRTNQYRVRLNDHESGLLNYAARTIGKPKSEILRMALVDYCNKLRITEANNEREDWTDWGLDGVSLKRVIECPACGASARIDLEDECTVTSQERPMGPETLYEFDYQTICAVCNQPFRVIGHISEYPCGALDSEEIRTAQT